jgi:hypothetical protein
MSHRASWFSVSACELNLCRDAVWLQIRFCYTLDSLSLFISYLKPFNTRVWVTEGNLQINCPYIRSLYLIACLSHTFCILTSGNEQEETNREVACFGNERYGIFLCCYYLSGFKLGSLRTKASASMVSLCI